MRGRFRTDHRAVAEAARGKAGIWKLAAVYPTRTGGIDAARRIPAAERTPSFAPAGAYDAYAAPHESGGTAVWVRYVLGMADLEPRPTTMTYKVFDRGSGREYVGVRVVTVTVAAECPRCGGPRAAGTLHRTCEDGDWYDAHQWANACGHTDTYAAVLAEHRRRLRAIRDEADRAVACSVIAGSDGDALVALHRDPRTVSAMASRRLSESSRPEGFESGMNSAVESIKRGEDLATAPWTVRDPAQTAGEIEALAGMRRLHLRTKGSTR